MNLCGSDASEFGAAESGKPDDGVVREEEGVGWAEVAWNFGVGEDVLQLFGGMRAEWYHSVAIAP